MGLFGGGHDGDGKRKRCPNPYCLGGIVVESGKKKQCRKCGGTGWV